MIEIFSEAEAGAALDVTSRFRTISGTLSFTVRKICPGVAASSGTILSLLICRKHLDDLATQIASDLDFCLAVGRGNFHFAIGLDEIVLLEAVGINLRNLALS